MTSGMSDFEIRTARVMQNIIIDPFDDGSVQPNSYDLHLGKDIYVNDGKKTHKKNLPYVLKTGEFILGTTNETVSLNKYVFGVLKGKSTIARHGVIVECAGLVDTGFSGQLTLEIKNIGWNDYELKEGQKIAQIVFFKCNQPSKLYNDVDNHYQYQKGATLPYE